MFEDRFQYGVTENKLHILLNQIQLVIINVLIQQPTGQLQVQQGKVMYM
jgi:hypothetical protein